MSTIYNLDQMSFDHIFHKNLQYPDNIYDFYTRLFYSCYLLNGERNNTFETHHVFQQSNEFFLTHNV